MLQSGFANVIWLRRLATDVWIETDIDARTAMKAHLKYWFWLGALTGIDPKRVKKLLDIYGNAYEVYRQPYTALAKLGFLNPQHLDKLTSPAIRAGLETRLFELVDSGIEVISLPDKRYPELVREISDPPAVLFMRGNAASKREDRAIAIVGTRRPTAYGISMTKKLVLGLAAYGFTIVSGLATGIDAYAHMAAIEGGAKTVAFLGCGVERAYPAINRKLMDDVIKNGAVYSEYLPGTIPFQRNFPQRNRLISGASLGTVVVEAGERSGALITAGFAGDQGRDVFAVPGNATSPLSQGTNALLRDGAQVVTAVEDIIYAMNKYIGSENREFFESAQSERKRIEKRIEFDRAMASLDVSERLVAKIVKDRGPQDIDSIAAQCSISAGDAGALAVMLEVKGLFRRMEDGAYMFAD